MLEKVKYNNISNKKDINNLPRNYITGENKKNNSKININNNEKNINIISNFGQEKSGHENINSYISEISGIKSNNKLSQLKERENEENIIKDKRDFKKTYNNVVNGDEKARALALIDQQNAIHEKDDLIYTDKDHRYAHGENYISRRKRKMSIQIDESQSKKNFKPNHRRRGSLGIKNKN